MSLVRQDVWPGVLRWTQDWDRLWDEFQRDQPRAQQWRPSVDIREFEDYYSLQADLPGVDPSQVEITLEQGQLTISGERESASETEGEQHRRVERVYGRFVRSFQLPDTADADNITAKSEHGVLHIRIPKRAQSQAVKIPVAS